MTTFGEGKYCIIIGGFSIFGAGFLFESLVDIVSAMWLFVIGAALVCSNSAGCFSRVPFWPVTPPCWSGYRLILFRECLSHDIIIICRGSNIREKVFHCIEKYIIHYNVRTDVRKYVVTGLKHSRESIRRYPDHTQRSLVVSNSLSLPRLLCFNWTPILIARFW